MRHMSINPSPNPPNPPSAAEPQPKGAPRAPVPPARRNNGEADSPQAAPEPHGNTPVNPDQADG